jgi:RNA polymerase sigma-70 factor, ECF subfamily
MTKRTDDFLIRMMGFRDCECGDVTGDTAPYSITAADSCRLANRPRFGIEPPPPHLITVDEVDYEQAVALYHEDLHRFALSLARNPDDARDLTQESYCRLLSKSAQLRDHTKVKSWLFTTLYRVFLGWKRHEKRFPHLEFSLAETQLPALTADTVDKMDGDIVMTALMEIDEHHRTPLILFYLQSLSYREIAELLDVPVGTVMSRLSRAKAILRTLVSDRAGRPEGSNVIPLSDPRRSKTST